MEVRARQLVIAGDFSDPDVVWHRFLELCNAIGVTILATVHHRFPGGGLSGVVVIGESHAAIHTWPEESAAWLELATCGSATSIVRFAEEAKRFGSIIRST